MAGYNIVFRQLDFTIAAGIINVKSTLGRIPFLLERFFPLVDCEFEVTWTIAAHEGESVNFLKRKRLITSEGVVQSSSRSLNSFTSFAKWLMLARRRHRKHRARRSC